MTDAFAKKDERWYRLEREGRIFSSLTAMIVVACASSNVILSVRILALFSFFDLIRASYSNHNLGPLIVLHHCVVMYMATIFECLQKQSKWWLAIAKVFMYMEITNPFLHTAWILMQASSPHIKQQFQWLAQLCFGLVVILWPQYRIGSVLGILWALLQESEVAMIVPTFAMLCLQIFWYAKICKIVQNLATKLVKAD